MTNQQESEVPSTAPNGAGYIPTEYDALDASDDAPVPDSNGRFSAPVYGALYLAARGIPIIPLRPKSKIPSLPNWPEIATTDEDTIWMWATEVDSRNFGVAAKSDGYLFFESDVEGTIGRYEAETGHKFEKTFTVESRPGRQHYYFRQTDATRAAGPIAQGKGGLDFGSLRQCNQMCVAAGSIHPETNEQYRIVCDDPIIDFPDAFLSWLIAQKRSSSGPEVASAAEFVPGQHISEGGRNNWLTRVGGKLRRDGLAPDEIEAVLLRRNREECVPPLDEEEVKQVARSVSRYAIEPERKVLLDGVEPGSNAVAAPVSAPLPTDSSNSGKISIPFSDDMFHGLAGRIIRKLQPETESHPVGNLLELLARFGSIVGASAYYQVESTRHYSNLFIVKVGRSSRTRKGTGRERIEEIARHLDSGWFDRRCVSGLGSGEVVIKAVRDASVGTIRDKRTGEIRTGTLDPGEPDKRLFVGEGEFAKVLTVAGRKESLLSSILRDAWDHRPLRNLVKGDSHSCQNPHISISADITLRELDSQLKQSDVFNGFANRFLWCLVERQGLKPHGGEEIDWTDEIIELHSCVEFARKQQRVFMDRNARLMWERIYAEFDKEDYSGAAGAVISRAEAQVIRLALIFALLDKSDHILVDHLKAALAVWQYSEDSARVIFGGVMKGHTRIVEFLRTGPKTIQEFREVLFAKHRKAEDIRIDLDTLVATGKVYLKTEAGVERFHLIGS